MDDFDRTRRRLATGILAAIVCASSVSGCSWDQADECAEVTDVDGLPGVECTKAGNGVVLALSTTEFRDGPVTDGGVGVWITAEPLRAE